MVGMSFAVVLVLSAIAGVALAQGPVDENGDGLCDECGEQVGDGLMLGPRYSQNADPQNLGRGSAFGDGYRDSFVDEDGDGVCDDFVDVDGDGICDECGMAYAGEPRGPQYVQNGDPQGLGRNQAYRDSFVDENGDGVCDDFVDEDGDGLCDNEGQYAERSLGGRDGNGGLGNWNRSQGQGLGGRNRS
jgi:hypothetical protein